MKQTFLLFCLLAIAGLQTAGAQDKSQTYAAVLTSFVDSHINSDFKKLNQILSDDATYKIPRQDQLIVQQKTALLEAMRQTKGVVQNCSSSSEILAKTDAFVIAKVNFKYPEFTQENYLTLEKDANSAWKISQVYKVFNTTGGSSSPVTTAF